MMIVQDQMQRTIQLEKTPRRIVSLVPSQTELLVDLGLEEQLVGITKFCVHPSRLRTTKTRVGGTKTIHWDKLRALHPDIIIANKEENTREIVEEAQKIAPVWVSDIVDIAGCLDMINRLGQLFGKPDPAQKIITNIEKQAVNFSRKQKHKSSTTALYLIWKNPYMAAGKNTFINTLLQVNRLDNVVVSEDRYPEIQESDFESAQLLLLATEPYPFQQKDVEELAQRYPDKKIILVNGEYFSWYGSRLQQAFDYFQTLDF